MGKSGRAIFAKVFLSYLSMTLISLLVLFVLYPLLENSQLEDSGEKDRIMLEQIRSTVDNSIGELNAITYYLKNNEDLLSVLKYSPEDISGSKYFEVYKLCFSLPRFNYINSSIQNVSIVCRNNAYVITPGGAGRRLSEMHDTLFGYTGFDSERIEDFMWKRTYVNELLLFPDPSSSRQAHIVLADSILYDGKCVGLVLVQMKNDFLEKLFNQFEIGKYGLIAVQDGQGQPIALHNQGEVAQGAWDDVSRHADRTNGVFGGYLVTRAASPVYEWEYVSITPKAHALAGFIYLQTILAVMAGFSVLVGMIMAYLVTRNKAAALIRIVNTLTGDQSDRRMIQKETYRYIESSISTLMAKQNDMKAYLDTQKPLLQAAYLRKLLYGDYSNETELKTICGQLGHEIDARKHVVVLSEVRWDANRSDAGARHDVALMTALKDAIEVLADTFVFILDLDTNTIALLLLYPAAMSDREIDAKVDALLCELRADVAKYDPGIRVLSCISDVACGARQIRNSMFLAQEITLRAGWRRDREFLRKGDIPPREEVFFFPFEEEFRMLQFIREGDSENLNKLLRNLYNVNFQEKTLSCSMVEQMLTVMRIAILRGSKEFLDHPGVALILNELSGIQIDALQFSHISGAAGSLCERMKEKGVADAQEKKHEILNYMRGNLHNPDFSIQSLSKHFFMSESAMYQFFRKNMRFTFADTLEKFRIERALELMKDASILIKDVAMQVGYVSDISFRRSFKKITGLSPSNYKSYQSTSSAGGM